MWTTFSLLYHNTFYWSKHTETCLIWLSHIFSSLFFEKPQQKCNHEKIARLSQCPTSDKIELCHALEFLYVRLWNETLETKKKIICLTGSHAYTLTHWYQQFVIYCKYDTKPMHDPCDELTHRCIHYILSTSTKYRKTHHTFDCEQVNTRISYTMIYFACIYWLTVFRLHTIFSCIF